MPTTPSSPAPAKKRDKKPTAGDYVAKVIVFLMMAFFGIVVNVVSYTDFVAIKDDLWLNSHGVLARYGSLHVHHGHRAESELCAYYDTQEGKPYSKCIPLWFPLVLIDEHSPEVIHYAPASPQHISTSWGRQILFSRTFSLLVALMFAFVIDFGVFVSIIEKLTGKELFAASSTPSQSVPPSAARTKAGSSLQSSALKLSRTLNNIVTNLQSNTGPNSAYAQASSGELAPLVAQYDHAILVAHSREQASEALNIIVEYMNDLIADTRKRKMSFGFRHWLAMRTYDDLHDIFRATKYRDSSL
jgi:hypothetical protein